MILTLYKGASFLRLILQVVEEISISPSKLLVFKRSKSKSNIRLHLAFFKESLEELPLTTASKTSYNLCEEKRKIRKVNALISFLKLMTTSLSQKQATMRLLSL
jgi:hypothetical protein